MEYLHRPNEWPLGEGGGRSSGVNVCLIVSIDNTRYSLDE